MPFPLWSRFHVLKYRFITPLKIYWGRLLKCPHPWRTLWMLIWPIPWKFRLPEPLDPLAILADPHIPHRRYYVEENFRSLRALPFFARRDTPLRSLYRLNDFICADSDNYIMLESQYFFCQNWLLQDIPDPRDPNPLRYALLASLVECMVEAFNFKISLGLRRGPPGRVSFAEDKRRRLEPNKPFEKAPAWTSRVPPADEWVVFQSGGVPNEMAQDPYSRRRLCVEISQLENI